MKKKNLVEVESNCRQQLEIAQMAELFLDKVENIVGKGENASYHPLIISSKWCFIHMQYLHSLQFHLEFSDTCIYTFAILAIVVLSEGRKMIVCDFSSLSLSKTLSKTLSPLSLSLSISKTLSPLLEWFKLC